VLRRASISRVHTIVKDAKACYLIVLSVSCMLELRSPD